MLHEIDTVKLRLRGFEGLLWSVCVRWLLKALMDSGLFRLIGFSLLLKVRAVLLYMAGLSYRDVAYALRVAPCSHEAVRLWVKRLEQLTVSVEARPRRMVAVDEAKLKVNGEWRYVWAAVDVDTRAAGHVGFMAEGHDARPILP